MNKTWVTRVMVGIALAQCLAANLCSAATSDDNLSADQIIQKSQSAYNALSSYRDEGTNVTTWANGRIETKHYRVKFARPDLYRIEWMPLPSETMVYWSDGKGDFTDFGHGVKRVEDPGSFPPGTPAEQMEERDRSINLANTGKAGEIARIFFSDSIRENQPTILSSPWVKTREPDEKAGDVACYVLSWQHYGKWTLWIGKQDFLIRQVRQVLISGGEAILLSSIHDNPAADAGGKVPNSGFTRIDVHTNIVINQKLTPSDFAH